MSQADYDRVRLGVLDRRNNANSAELNSVSFAESPIYMVQLIRDRKEIRAEMEMIHARLAS